MRATAVLPIKRFGAAKTRLSDALSPTARADLAAAMLADVLAALGRCERIERILVISGEPRAAAAAAAAAGVVELIDDPTDAGHSEAALLGVAAALAAGAGCAALLPGDCPLLSPAELDAALADLSPGTAGVIPDRHGAGTNGLLLAPPDAITPAFGPGSRERHLGLARAVGVGAQVVEIPSLALDLDTAEDLRELTRAVRAEPADAPATARALGVDG